MKRLMHPEHGIQDVNDGHQEKAMRLNGWTDDDGKALADKLAGLGIEDDAEHDVELQEQPKRRGRKPAEPTGE